MKNILAATAIYFIAAYIIGIAFYAIQQIIKRVRKRKQSSDEIQTEEKNEHRS